MVRIRYLSSLATLAMGAAIGYFVAASETQPPVHAAATQSPPSNDTAPPAPDVAVADQAQPGANATVKPQGISRNDQVALNRHNQLATASLAQSGKKPNILVIFGDDIGQTNISAYSMGLMGYRTPNIDRIAREGMIFTYYYAEQSCTAGRSSFITGQCTFRTGLSKVGVPGATVGLQREDPTIAELLKNHGYATAQFGKNHLGDMNDYLPTVHGFDEFFGNLYHLNAEEEP